MNQPPKYDCQVGDHVFVRQLSFIGPANPPHEAVVVECRDQWITVRYIDDGLIDMVHKHRLLFDTDKGRQRIERGGAERGTPAPPSFDDHAP